MKRIFLIFALCLSLALLASCAPISPETPTAGETEAATEKAPSDNKTDGDVDEIVDRETTESKEEETEGNTDKTEGKTESETEPPETHNVIVGDDLDENTSPVPSEDDTVRDEWELGGVPLG